MAKSIEAVEGIGPKYGARLRAIGCSSPARLLEMGATPAGRRQIARRSGISEAVIARCVNMADLFRLKGVASQYAELLEASGVDTVRELRKRRADNLRAKMQAVNAARRLCRQVPSEKTVAEWIAQAGRLEPVPRY